jgi:sulfonate transport system ATP-binding protein
MALALKSQGEFEPVAASRIDISGVYKSFEVDHGRVDALKDVSLAIEPGAFVSLVGPSGCGKSTLLRLIAGLDLPDGGLLSIDGTRIQAPSLTRGMVFQDHRLLPWLSVEQNILLSLHKSGESEAHKRQIVQDLVTLVGLAGFEKAKPDQLSGGMSQRAAIARALAAKPRVLLLDEPFGALDSLTRLKLQAELLRIWRHERITMVMVTHDVEEAVVLSDTVVVMEPRPGRVRSIFEVDLPKPRDRADPRLAAFKARILADLGIE